VSTHDSIAKNLLRFPQSAREILIGGLIGFATAYVLIVPLSLAVLATALVFLILLLKAANEK
jgi:uncharacterized membrane protein (Fun14 family)